MFSYDANISRFIKSEYYLQKTLSEHENEVNFNIAKLVNIDHLSNKMSP